MFSYNLEQKSTSCNFVLLIHRVSWFLWLCIRLTFIIWLHDQTNHFHAEDSVENKSNPNQMKLYSILPLQEYQNLSKFPFVLMKHSVVHTMQVGWVEFWIWSALTDLNKLPEKYKQRALQAKVQAGLLCQLCGSILFPHVVSAEINHRASEVSSQIYVSILSSLRQIQSTQYLYGTGCRTLSVGTSVWRYSNAVY